MGRIDKHPILNVPHREDIEFTFNGRSLHAKEGEVISSALFAEGIRVFGHHHRDGAPLGIYCANGQCSQCMVIVDGNPVKACMTMVREGMKVESCEGKPKLTAVDTVPETAQVPMAQVPTVHVQCLIIGGGPAGLSAACEMGKLGVKAILIDDKHALGGKLTLQTHTFFGSRRDCYAGMRGIDIARLLEEELQRYPDIEVWLNASGVGIFCDGKVGIVKQGNYFLVKPEILLVAAGAREKTLAFPGCDLPGVYGAGAFQTLVNRDLVRPARRLFICGGGNVGLIAGYHALQAGIDVVGVTEMLPVCGGYKVHLDKIKRFGVPVYTSHTVLRAEGKTHLERVTIGRIAEDYRPLQGSERIFQVDTLLIAVGLAPVNEMYLKAKEYGMKVFAAGDAEEIAEASAAMLSGRIQGRRIVRELKGYALIQGEWGNLMNELRSKPGPIRGWAARPIHGKVYPVIRCTQEIPCNPCMEVCPLGAIRIPEGSLKGIPSFEGDSCLGCALCVLACPGLAIVLVDEGFDPKRKRALVVVPSELAENGISPGDEVMTVGMEGQRVGTAQVVAFRDSASQDRRRLVLLDIPFRDRLEVAGIRLQFAEQGVWEKVPLMDEDTIICRCERVTKREIVELIRDGYRDMNQIKAALRTGMGACGGKNCTQLILQLFREEGVALEEVTMPVYRPLEAEVSLGILAGHRRDA